MGSTYSLAARINDQKEVFGLHVGRANSVHMAAAIAMAAKALDEDAAAETIANEMDFDEMAVMLYCMADRLGEFGPAKDLAPVIVKIAKRYAERFPESF